jgi:hypothetical protein
MRQQKKTSPALILAANRFRAALCNVPYGWFENLPRPLLIGPSRIGEGNNREGGSTSVRCIENAPLAPMKTWVSGTVSILGDLIFGGGEPLG